MFDDLPLSQQQTKFDIWIQQIKTVGKHSLPVIHMLSYTRNLFPTNFTASDKMMVHITKTHIVLCLMIFHSTKSKHNLIFGFSTSKQLEMCLFQ